MGVGDMPAANGLRSANAIWVYDNMSGARPATRDGFVAWPPPGFVPYSIVYARWSLSLPKADFSQALITMTNVAGQMVTRKEANAGGYGENTLVWVPDGLADNARWARPLTDTVYTVTVANVSVGGEKRTFSYNVTVFDPVFTGKAPTGIVLTSNTVDENQPAGTVIGTMSAVDPDAADGHTFKLINGTGGADNGLFAIVGDTLVTSATFNYEEADARTIRVQVTDHSGLSYVQIMTVDITNINEAPALPRSEVLVKGDAYVYSIRAIDPEGDSSSVSVISAPAWMNVAVDGTLITVSGSCSSDPGADNVVHLQLRDASGLTAEVSLAFQAARTVILIPLIVR